MIPLFNIKHRIIDTSRFSNLLHDKVVRNFEDRFAEYVGANYAVSLNSATSAIFLIFTMIRDRRTYLRVSIPSIIPPVVPNALINAGCAVSFTNNVKWVGDSYEMMVNDPYGGIAIIDSAQSVDRNQYIAENLGGEDLMIFSFYPTKPVGSCDGGMVVSNKPLDWLREASFNGMSFAENNWDRKITSVGHKMYMNSLQAFMGLQSLQELDAKKEILFELRSIYNNEFGLTNTSDHLYRIPCQAAKPFIARAWNDDITCGIHYEALHKHPLYTSGQEIPEADEAAKTMVSIPFHEGLSKTQIDKIIKFVHGNR